ncbi:CDC45-like protein [Ceratocystis lukuohia]|uniref:CDC45-like protein n=1 Tax=Ceratocystis lukuohia TaxID=2019550 RepID=A0ABR4MU17_9PEZI
MYLPRSLLSKLYVHLQRSRHPLSPPVLILVALEPDALCACRILTRMLKHDYIQHKIQPIAGYADLEKAGQDLVAPMMQSRGGSGGVVVCLGVGGMADMGSVLGLEPEDDTASYSGVEVWLLDSHRPWNLSNIFGGYPSEASSSDPGQAMQQPPPGVDAGKISHSYRPGTGGIIAFDDGDIDDLLSSEQEAYTALVNMPEIDDQDLGNSDDDDSDDEVMESAHAGQKRKSSDVHFDDDDDSDDDDRPRQRRRSNSSTPIPILEKPTGRGLMVARSSQSLTIPGSDPFTMPSGAQPQKGPSARALKRRLVRMRDEKEAVIRKYYSMGSSFSDPITSTMYALASEMGREDNDLLWFCIVGVSSMEMYGRSSAGLAAPVRGKDSVVSGWLGVRGARIRQVLRDEVRRLNPPDVSGVASPEEKGIIPTTARSPEDNGIRLSPEPKFLLIRHWSLYDSMLHSPYLFSRLRTWSESGIKRLHKLLAKMGVSLVQCKQSYVHMDMTLKRDLRQKLLKYAALYNLEEMVPSLETDGKDRAGAKDGWGFVRSWGWKATLSAQDVVVILGALLEIGKDRERQDKQPYYGSSHADEDVDGQARTDEWITRFWQAYDALEDVDALKAGLSTAQYLHRAIYRTGTSLINKRQIKHLRAFRLCVVKDGADVELFTHPAALTKLALWIGEALTEQERDQLGKLSHSGRGTPLVAASLDEKRGVYTVVGTGGGGGPDTAFLNREAARKRAEQRERKAAAREAKRLAKAEAREEKRAARREAAAKKKAEKAKEQGGQEDDNGGDGVDGDGDEELDTESEGSESESESEDEDEDDMEASQERGYGLNKFGAAFQEVIAETNARVRVDSFEHSVVEVKKEDLGNFLETLSMKAVIGHNVTMHYDDKALFCF